MRLFHLVAVPDCLFDAEILASTGSRIILLNWLACVLMEVICILPLILAPDQVICPNNFCSASE